MKMTKTSDFDYELPPELIAQQPLADRTSSRMMVVERATGVVRHDRFFNLGQYMRDGDLLVLNDTRVIPARIWSTAPPVELLLVEKLADNRWTALVKPGKRARAGAVLQFEDGLAATVEGETDFGGRVLRFAGDVESYLKRHGAAPLPPYIKRARFDAGDIERYQTVFARQPGAVAAPTAGLHFTREMLDRLRADGVDHAFITLHVGIGTFRPVKVEEVEQHRMHAEKFSISQETAEALKAVWSCARGIPDPTGRDRDVAPTRISGQDSNISPTGRTGRIIAVGTTVVRTLETVGEPRACDGSTDIFIRPPYQFQVVDAMLTNFHLPRSTLLMLVSAFASRELILRAYAEAVRDRYRFFSYGDCMLIM
jgi:S-adenosylmethionine:tRNA ribosyltransferase-isomerase